MDESTLVNPRSTDGDEPHTMECGEAGCDYVAEGPRARMALGAHRLRAHGIKGGSDRTERRHKAPSQPKAPRAPGIKQQIRQNVEATHAFGAILFAPAFPNASAALTQQSKMLQETWAACSDTPWVRQFWGMGGEVSKWLAVGIAYLPIGLGMLADVQLRRAARAEQAGPVVDNGQVPVGEPASPAA